MTPLGDIGIEFIFRVAVRGRARDLAELMRTLEEAQVVVLFAVKDASTLDKTENKGVVVNIGSLQP